jgi:flagellum-specific peptidoglycan hydrolase FlgJ
MKKMLTLVCFTVSLPYLAQRAYFDKYQTMADSFETVYGIPSALMLAVAMQESGGGTSRVAKLLNNHFGIMGKNNLLKTHGIKSRYQWYASDTASYEGFCKLVARRKFYTNLKGNSNALVWVKALGNSGYAGSHASVWIASISRIIKSYKLS